MALFPKNADYLCLCKCFHLAAVMLILTAFVGFAGLREFPDWQQSSVTHVDQWCTSDALSGLYNPLELCSLSITHSKASTHIQHGIFPPKQLFLKHNFLTPPSPSKKGQRGSSLPSIGLQASASCAEVLVLTLRCVGAHCLYLQGQK